MEKNLGHATAYGYAKSKGYSGTEDEFAQLMADYASVGQSAAQSAEQAAASATSASGSAATATQSAQTATSKASEAVTAANTATTKASEASTSADTASTAAQTATDKASEATTAATTATAKASEASELAATATTAKTDAESARDAAAQSASEAAESARTLTIDATLTKSGQAADAKETGDKITGLKEDLDEFEDGFHNLNLFVHDAELLYENGYASIDNGKISAKQPNNGNNAYLLPVDGLSTYTFTACRFAFLVDSDKETAIGSLLQNVTQIDSTGASYICFSINKDSYPISTYQCSKGTSLRTGFALPNWFNAAEEDIGDAISTKIDKNGTGQVKPQNIEGVTVTGGNILNDAERIYCSQSGHVGSDGYVTISDSKAIIQNASSYCSFLITVKPNTHYTANNSIRFAVLLKNLATESATLVEYTTVVGSVLANISSFDTGEADHIIVSWNYSTYPINTFIISEGNTASADIHVSLPDWWTGGAEAVKPKYISTTGSLSDGTFLALMGYKQNLRKGERYAFSGDLTTMSELRFGFTYLNAFSASATIYNEFAIDNTYITYKTNGSSTSYTNRYEHGLTFANNLQFIFEYLPEGNAKITLISNGMMFAQTLAFTKDIISQVVVVSSGSTLTDCKLTWTPIDIDKDIWIFGDSYVSYSTNRWPYYLQDYDYAKHALIDGFPGEGSVNARNSLITLIRFGAPKYVVWCMGMNDGSDTNTSTPSTDWTRWRDEMLTICEQNKITPIFATIPNVPSVLNTGKNAWIKSSGYRYIDFAKAVGAEAAGSTWYAGMLSPDNVHPSERGAKALFARFLLDFPEIMLDGTN